ncbi:hypothetical protein TUBRATIS_002250 [Tubulinosema ratisbonensis]|uniref:Uncharacterized protein n=1 Tax=Tubulinosema ratisbonensis TaxID=291195 RepID=A0A437AQ12_9MICR|nr:hypothetical protein TUBRATIS_002250 [Tubulinosema ratisbonensis]
MFDIEYFNEFNDETIYLVESKEKKPIQQDDEEKIEANILTLKYLLNQVTETELRDKLINKLSSIFKNQSFEITSQPKLSKKSEEINENLTNILQDDLLKCSSALKRRAVTFAEKVEEDKEIVKNTNEIIEKQVVKTDLNLKNMREVEGLSLYSIFLFTLVLFFAVYFVMTFL